MKFTILGMLSLLLAVVSSCEKEYEFPPITQEGKNTFGCKINGKEFVPGNDHQPFSMNLRCSYERIDENERLVVSVIRDKSGSLGGMILDLNGLKNELKVGTYGVYDFEPGSAGFFGSRYHLGKQYVPSREHDGQLEVLRFDREARIFAGKFHFTFIDEPSGETLTITEGRFDVKWY